MAYQYEAQKLRAQVCSLMIPELRDVRAGDWQLDPGTDDAFPTSCDKKWNALQHFWALGFRV